LELGSSLSGEAVIHSLGSAALDNGTIESVDLVGSDAKLHFEQRTYGLHLTLPAQAPGKYAYAFRIHLEDTAP